MKSAQDLSIVNNKKNKVVGVNYFGSTRNIKHNVLQILRENDII